LINGEEKSIDDEENNRIAGDFLSEINLKDHTILFTQTVPRAKIPRSSIDNNGDTTIFYMERIRFSEGSGLYLIAAGDTNLFEKGLHILQHEGIGTDRNVGQGTFELHTGKINGLKIPETNHYATNLGLFCPEENNVNTLTETDSDMLPKKSKWDMIKRGGWITTEGFTGIRKKYIYMFDEGSVLNTGKSGVHSVGKVNCDLKPDEVEGLNLPDHPVWRCGRTLLFPVRL
jgi:CRISPR-associated protein Csm4